MQVQFAINDGERADEIVAFLLAGHLVACGQRIGPMVSRYWWEGSLEQAQEWLVLLKTRAELAARVTAAIVGAHPYQTPEVITLAIVGGSPGYLEWIADATAEG
ncbi:MAG: divalent-cation tolerance protein CutA [Acidimicrobiales bacterium]